MFEEAAASHRSRAVKRAIISPIDLPLPIKNLLIRLLKKSICFIVFVAAEATYMKKYASFLAPRFNWGLAYGAF